MIFSPEKWNNAGEIQPYISVGKGLKFATVQAPLLSSFEMFLRPLLGDALTADLIAYYTDADSGNKQNRFVQLAQRANALLAFWYDYDEMQLLISDTGSKRQESDHEKTPYKYQEQALKNGWKVKGFNALDDVLSFLELEKSTFENYNGSASKTDIVRTTAEVDKYYFISGSRIILLRLRPHFQIVVDTIISPRLGSIYTNLIAELVKETPDPKYTKLREALIPVVVFYSVARLMRETGSLTDKGLFFETLKNTDDAVNTSPVSDGRMNTQATMAEADAINYWKIAEKLMKSTLEYTGNTGSKMPKRDNNDKKAFWG